MTKQELRLYFKEFLTKNIDKINSDLIKTSLLNQVSNLLKQLKVKHVGIYYPLKYEINLLEIININHEIKFFLPKIINNEIKYCTYNYNDELVLSSFKTLEPINNDFYKPELIIVPGLAFSKDGYRLGYGKGHFDRYINNNKDILTVGVCLKEQVINNFPIESHDQKLNFIISI
ncbi:5-formyltetrahydrofolate cyclo-ligase [Rickettsia endosymbiont of Pantilius tunicatus]|uniref:5-formyltetrahydrofolate cyclo-ligase n=1 Tax=unclassified Rickettsia TaxID=114295 RepID=UPI0030E112A3